MWRVVFDTNVLVSALRSSLGAAFALLNTVPSARFRPVLSASLFNEHLDVLHRPGLLPTALSKADVDDFCDDFAAASILQEIYYHWPGYLPDPKASFGLRAVAPGEFLRLVRSPIS